MYTNGSKILDTKQGKGVITCINGIRFLSMTWVIIGHAFSAPNNIADNIAEFMPRMLKRWTFMAVCNAYVSVDSFFTLSGLLLTYLVMKELDKNKGRLKWFMFYFHRFWRLTPPYMLVIMVSVSLFHYTGTGPNWPTGGIDKGCEKGWWYNLLYINNFVEDNKKKCFGVAWYLANDMQFYILSPLILLPLYHFHLLGVGILMVFLVGTTITTGVISTHYDIPANNFDAGDATHWKKLYVKPYCRIGPYLVGMYAGYILYRTNCKVHINRYLNLAIWSAAIGTGMAIVYGLYDDINSETPLPTSVAAFYNAVHRTAWGLCISWVIFACATGNGGFINTILSWKAFIPLSRLTYMAYLVHMMILNHWKYSQTKTIHLSDSEYIYEIVGHIVLSFMAAFVTSLAFESPMLGLESVIFRRKQNKR
ncbi:nose resistant to fluoxetine protein 6-like [Mytilus trossulus]